MDIVNCFNEISPQCLLHFSFIAFANLRSLSNELSPSFLSIQHSIMYTILFTTENKNIQENKKERNRSKQSHQKEDIVLFSQ